MVICVLIFDEYTWILSHKAKMAECMLPRRISIQLQLKLGTWLEMTPQPDGVLITLKDSQNKIQIPPTLWQAMLDQMELLADLQQCLLRPTCL